MTLIYLLGFSLFIVYPIAALEKKVKWPLLMRYIVETAVMALTAFILMAPFIGKYLHLGYDTGSGAFILWWLGAGFVIAFGELLGYLRYRMRMRRLQSDGAREMISWWSHASSIARLAFWVWLCLSVLLLVAFGVHVYVDNVYRTGFQILIVVISVLAAIFWKKLRG